MSDRADPFSNSCTAFWSLREIQSSLERLEGIVHSFVEPSSKEK